MAQTYQNYFKVYENEKIRRISLHLSKEKDADILKEIEGKNIQGTIKELIREGMKARRIASENHCDIIEQCERI